ncbi:MAG: hypothetical protein EPO08_13885 [Rhodospirillaceae bacterium]|nr:MAG: hypothetical protein EPO08_13885 [Rhodospirillaceae bacterium]
MSHHLITIKVPVPANSISGASKVMTGYAAELEALKAKLPDGHEWDDHISNPRPAGTTTRKTMEEKIKEAVETDRRQRPGGHRQAAE